MDGCGPNADAAGLPGAVDRLATAPAQEDSPGVTRVQYRDRLRAQIVLDAAGDYANAAIARRRRVTQDTVRKWRGRFAAEGLAGLIDRKRTGSPAPVHRDAAGAGHRDGL